MYFLLHLEQGCFNFTSRCAAANLLPTLSCSARVASCAAPWAKTASGATNVFGDMLDAGYIRVLGRTSTCSVHATCNNDGLDEPLQALPVLKAVRTAVAGMQKAQCQCRACSRCGHRSCGQPSGRLLASRQAAGGTWCAVRTTGSAPRRQQAPRRAPCAEQAPTLADMGSATICPALRMPNEKSKWGLCNLGSNLGCNLSSLWGHDGICCTPASHSVSSAPGCNAGSPFPCGGISHTQT